MSTLGYTEDALIEQPAIELLQKLGWETYNAFHEFDGGKSSLGRETKSEVVLIDRLLPALRRLNPNLTEQALALTVEELTRGRSQMSPASANREIYQILKNGYRAHIPDANSEENVDTVAIIDWDNPANNDYLLCSQFWITGEMHNRRADLVCFVNGIPLLMMEFKAAHIGLEAAYSANLRDYKDTIPQLFWYNALIILSNGSQSRLGSITAGWEHFNEWKKVDSETEPGCISLETMLRGVCDPTRLLDIVENFTVFQDVPGGLIKLIAKNHQYLGVNNAIAALQEIRQRKGKLGVFWHTQGSGKSVSMVFFAQKVLRKVPGNWTFVVVTDRQELDAQIYKQFISAGVVTETRAQAESGRHLRQLLCEDHRYVFTLIHKFRTEKGEAHPVLSERDDVIVITDEAHRTQYDTLALNMRTALPNAAFLAFTGTPLFVGEEKTRQVFGGYISIYDFQQSVQDGATVPLYYENRIPELQIINDNFNTDMETLLDEAELDEEQEKRLQREFAREYHLITREDRLDAVARDLVKHMTGRGFQGKAMMVCIDKATAVRMYDKVRHYWGEKISSLALGLNVADEMTGHAIKTLLTWMKQTDMAVVVSQGQNEIADMRDKGLDIRPHRKRLLEEDLETKFKNPDDPFRLAFVCAMWMTGFDVPSCSTLYLDKPMRNHTLMQTIARVNRVYPGKVNGLIVDYAGVFRSLEKALAIYGSSQGAGSKPVSDKSVLVESLSLLVEQTTQYLHEHGVDMEAIKAATGFARVKLMDDAVDALVGTEENKRQYLALANSVERTYKAILPDRLALQFIPIVVPIQIIALKIRALNPAADITEIMRRINELLDTSIATDGYQINKGKEKLDPEQLIDISKIDFELLAKKFQAGRKRTTNEMLKAKIGSKLDSMVRINRTRADYLAQFQALIDKYNKGGLTDEQFFHELMEFAKSLELEEKRAISEQLSEEELAIFDLLTKPSLDLSKEELDQIKAVARGLLDTLKKEKFTIDWRKHQKSRAEVRVTIEKVLDVGLPRKYDTNLYRQKSAAVFLHVYDSYYGAGRSIYAEGR